MPDNIQVLIDSIPEGRLKAENYRVAHSSIPELGPNEILVETHAIAITAGTRAGLQGSASYAGAPKTGVPMNSTGIGKVIESNTAEFDLNDMVTGPTGWQAYSKHKPQALTKIDPEHNPVDYLGPLGVNGLTAYFGLFEVGQIKANETVMISAAAGSVGHMVGQIAKIAGCSVIGVCGDGKKTEQLIGRLGFDAAVNYKVLSYRDELKAATPNGVDIFFDNTGGSILGSALRRLNVGGRVACCGVVSQYDTNNPEPGPKGIPGLLINKRLTMKGFLVFDYIEKYAEARKKISKWLISGELHHLTDEVIGLENAPDAFVDLLSGGNIGTRIIKLH